MWSPCGQVSAGGPGRSLHESCTSRDDGLRRLRASALPDRVEDVAADVARPAGAEVLPRPPLRRVVDVRGERAHRRGAEPQVPVAGGAAARRPRAGRGPTSRYASIAPGRFAHEVDVLDLADHARCAGTRTAMRSPMPEACWVPSWVTTPACFADRGRGRGPRPRRGTAASGSRRACRRAVAVIAIAACMWSGTATLTESILVAFLGEQLAPVAVGAGVRAHALGGLVEAVLSTSQSATISTPGWLRMLPRSTPPIPPTPMQACWSLPLAEGGAARPRAGKMNGHSPRQRRFEENACASWIGFVE